MWTKTISILSISALLTGCALTPQPKPQWYKPNTSAEEASNYHAECIYNVGMNKVEHHKELKLVDACMIKAGFRWGIPPEENPATK